MLFEEEAVSSLLIGCVLGTVIGAYGGLIYWLLRTSFIRTESGMAGNKESYISPSVSKVQKCIYGVFLTTTQASFVMALLMIWEVLDVKKRVFWRLFGTCALTAVVSALTLSATRTVASDQARIPKK